MPEPGDIYRLAVKFLMPDEVEAINAIDVYTVSGAATEAQLLLAVASFIEEVYDNVDTIINSNVDIVECRVNKMVWETSRWVVHHLVGVVYPTFAATAGGDMLPHAVAGLIEFPTGFPRRVGKKYIPGLSEACTVGSDVQTGTLTAFSNFALDLLNGFTAGTAAFIYEILADTGYPLAPSTAYIPPLISSQRRRKPGVGS